VLLGGVSVLRVPPSDNTSRKRSSAGDEDDDAGQRTCHCKQAKSDITHQMTSSPALRDSSSDDADTDVTDSFLLLR